MTGSSPALDSPLALDSAPAPVLVTVEGLEKTYRVFPSPWHRLAEALSGRRFHQPVRAVREVEFELKRGESLGIVGENGAGKSTLLSILAGVTAPTAGAVSVAGRTASLLELGMGFHPELTGRQNIRLSAAMMGFQDEEVAQKTPQIIDFSELGEFIDRPIKTYSSGMKMRLGFALAVQVEPDVLIVDEALSVGDGYFQKKCMDAVRNLLDRGCTFLFCSHAMYYVTTFCERALWMRDGRPEALGPANDVVRTYENFLIAKDGRRVATADGFGAESSGSESLEGSAGGTEGGDDARPQGALAQIRAVRQTHGDGHSFRHRESWGLEIEWEASDPELEFQVGVGVDRSDGIVVLSLATHLDDLPPMTGERHYTLRLDVHELPMLKGEFDVTIFLLGPRGLHVYDQRVLPASLEIVSDHHPLGLVAAEHAWRRD